MQLTNFQQGAPNPLYVFGYIENGKLINLKVFGGQETGTQWFSRINFSPNIFSRKRLFQRCLFQSMIDYPQLNRNLSRMPIKGFLYHNNKIYNAIKGKDDERSMLKCFNYILLLGAQIKCLKPVDKQFFMRMLRGIARSEARVRDSIIFKSWKKESVNITKMATKVIHKIDLCCSCAEIPVQTICSKFFVCYSCNIVFKLLS